MHTFKHPVFITCAVVFALHQLMQKGFRVSMPLLDCYLDNILCLPILFSMLLAERRWWWLRREYTLPPWEVATTTLLLIFLFEWAFPVWSPHFTADYWDVPLYIIGAAFFYFAINK